MKQLFLPQPIPWYRTRWFWGIIIGIAGVWGLYVLFALLPPARTLTELLSSLFYAFGAGPFSLFGFKLLGGMGSKIFTSIYFLIMSFLLYKTFRPDRINPIYPSIFIVLFAIGSWIGFGYLSGL